VDARFLLDEGKATRIEAVVAEMWPETIHPSEIGSESLAGRVRDAREALLGVLSLDELL
jgi:succinylarginine dihydrolase